MRNSIQKSDIFYIILKTNYLFKLLYEKYCIFRYFVTFCPINIIQL